MSKTKQTHTPRPWHKHTPTYPANHAESLDFGIAADINGKKRIIAEAFGRVSEDSFAPSEANANLIAAAPDLLEALEHCRIMLNETHKDNFELINEIDEAINKAKGDS